MHVYCLDLVKFLLMNIQDPMQTQQYPQEIIIKYDLKPFYIHLFHLS